MEPVKKAKERLAKYPLLFSKCTKQGSDYARCVLLHEESLKKGVCDKEFQAFNTCIQSAAKNIKTRI